MSNWTTYILKCNDDSYYTGITNDLKKRVSDHENGKGAKYTRGRGPFKIVFQQNSDNRSQASKREIEIKRLSRKEKEALIKQNR